MCVLDHAKRTSMYTTMHVACQHQHRHGTIRYTQKKSLFFSWIMRRSRRHGGQSSPSLTPGQGNSWEAHGALMTGMPVSDAQGFVTRRRKRAWRFAVTAWPFFYMPQTRADGLRITLDKIPDPQGLTLLRILATALAPSSPGRTMRAVTRTTTSAAIAVW